MSLSVECTTSTGPITLSFQESLAPNGFRRVRELFEDNFYDGNYFYRMIPSFLVQFGVSSVPSHIEKYTRHPIPDDPHPPGQVFKKGTISYAGSGPNSRTSDLFITLSDATSLGKSPWEVPIGHVSSGYSNIESFYAGYGDISAFNKAGVDQGRLRREGKKYVQDSFSKLDFINECKIVDETVAGNEGSAGNAVVGNVAGSEFDGRGLPAMQPGIIPHSTTQAPSFLLILAYITAILSLFSTLLLSWRLWGSRDGRKKDGVRLDERFRMYDKNI